MAKFCTKCGKPLKDGKPCDCEKESVSNDNVVGDYLDILKGMFKNPSKVLKNEADEKNLTFSLGSILVNAIIFGLTINFLLNNIFAKAGLNLSSITNSIGSIANQLSSFGVNINVNTNYGLNSGIFCFAMSVLIVVVLYVMHSVVFKEEINYKDIISLVGISEMFFTVGLLITLVISFISPLLALFILVIFAFCFFVHIHEGMIEIGNTNNNQTVYTVAASIAIPVILFLAIFVTMLSIEIMFLLRDSFSSSMLLGFIIK